MSGCWLMPPLRFFIDCVISGIAPPLLVSTDGRHHVVATSVHLVFHHLLIQLCFLLTEIHLSLRATEELSVELSACLGHDIVPEDNRHLTIGFQLYQLDCDCSCEGC
ncbi:hypothetical protein HOU26_gp63 [Escherichia phage IMM-002]|uniref:Uncharacterized protein n=1 Tax=Escherichia phage IMM-002 TaxID=2041760 RepID=A0A384WIK0_9CAUD|nr:hypothetical protein HOU26_gp63 [Escherichia phage IMM-002]ATI17022.1 hypothetical protein [Escherichia phage IMM-002]